MAEERLIYGPNVYGWMIGLMGNIFGHIGVEKLLNRFFEPKYPEKYQLYSLGSTSAIMLVIVLILIAYVSTKADPKRAEYFGVLAGISWGLIAGEIYQLLEIIRKSFEIGG